VAIKAIKISADGRNSRLMNCSLYEIHAARMKIIIEDRSFKEKILWDLNFKFPASGIQWLIIL
jgi:hypothetical protein